MNAITQYYTAWNLATGSMLALSLLMGWITPSGILDMLRVLA